MIIYSGPIEEVENPTKEFIENIIFNKNEEYWKQGSGDSCIDIDGCDERLIFFMMNHMAFL